MSVEVMSDRLPCDTCGHLLGYHTKVTAMPQHPMAEWPKYGVCLADGCTCRTFWMDTR